LAACRALEAFDFFGPQLADCDAQIESRLHRLRKAEADPVKDKRRGSARNAPQPVPQPSVRTSAALVLGSLCTACSLLGPAGGAAFVEQRLGQLHGLFDTAVQVMRVAASVIIAPCSLTTSIRCRAPCQTTRRRRISPASSSSCPRTARRR
jgi:hypothetical protein